MDQRYPSHLFQPVPRMQRIEMQQGRDTRPQMPWHVKQTAELAILTFFWNIHFPGFRTCDLLVIRTTTCGDDTGKGNFTCHSRNQGEPVFVTLTCEKDMLQPIVRYDSSKTKQQAPTSPPLSAHARPRPPIFAQAYA